MSRMMLSGDCKETAHGDCNKKVPQKWPLKFPPGPPAYMRRKCRPVDKDRGVSFAPKGETAKCVSLHTLDRLYGLGPITAFAMGEPPASGLQDDGKGGSVPVQRGCKQLVSCVGSGKSGAIACVRGGVVAKQITSFPLGAVGQCTGASFRTAYSQYRVIAYYRES